MSVQNPNWPLIDVAVSFLAGPSDPMPAPYWVSMKGRTLGQIGTNRGRQYELDQVQTGTWAGSLENTDAALDPSNTASPFYPQVLPYRAFRHRAQYPATINVLTADQATAGKASGLALGTLPTWTSLVPAGAMTLTTVASSGSTNAYQLAYGASNTIGAGVSWTGFSVSSGASHAFSCSVTASANNGLQVRLSVQWVGPAGTVLSTVSGSTVTATTVAQTATLVATPPSGACGAIVRLLSVNSVVSATTILALAVQAEYDTSTHTFVIPNKWYSIFTGYVERWPQTWSMNGQFGQSNLVVVDAFGYLSQRKLLSSAYQEMLKLGPSFFYPLDEDSNSTLFYDDTAQKDPLFVKVVTGSPILAGSALASTGGWKPSGIGGPVLTLKVAGADEGQVQMPKSAIPVGSAWTRIFAFNAGTQANSGTLWIASPITNQVQAYLNGPGYFIFMDGSGRTFSFGVVNAAGVITVTSGVVPGSTIFDGGWHLVAISVSSDGKTWSVYLDGNLAYSTTVASDTRLDCSTGFDILGAIDANLGGPLSQSYSFLGELPYAATLTQMSLLYSTFRYGGSGLGTASSTSRYSDILRWIAWVGLSSVDSFTTGETVAYGPATELNAPASAPGTDVVSALQTVVDTEAGFHFVAADGTITLKARRARYNLTAPVVTFGEHAGEVPYTTVQTGYDPTRVANDISAVQTQTSAASRSLDAASSASFGDIQLQRTVNTLNALEQADAANYLRIRNSKPVQRIEGLSVNVGANPALWATMLALELGTIVRVMRRPPLGAAAIQVDGFVEQINWTFDDKGNVYVDLQVSVNNQQQFWQLDSSTFSVLDSTTVMGY